MKRPLPGSGRRADSSVEASQRRLSAGSMTASISSVAATSIALPFSYCAATSRARNASRSSPSLAAASSLR